jgi:hypothetical protein
VTRAGASGGATMRAGWIRSARSDEDSSLHARDDRERALRRGDRIGGVAWRLQRTTKPGSRPGWSVSARGP